MAQLLDLTALVPEGAITRTARFDGEDYGAGASFFFVDNDPGQGPGLHWHPYSETWIVIEGLAEFVAGDETFRAGLGSVATIPPEVHHRFTNVGQGRMRMLCIHAGPRIIQFDLEH